MLIRKSQKFKNYNLIILIFSLSLMGICFSLSGMSSYAETFNLSDFEGVNFAVEDDKNIKMTLNADGSILTLSGNGTLKESTYLPWYSEDTNECLWPEEILEVRIVGNSSDDPIYANANSSDLLLNGRYLTNIYFENFNTQNIVDATRMFKGCSSIEQLELSSLKMNKIEIMNNMFGHCTNLRHLDLSTFDTSRVLSMYSLFYGCENLEDIVFGENFHASNCEDISHMFFGCQNLSEINLGNKFNTSKVKKMEYMFFNCNKLISLNLGQQFFTSKVTNMSCMFCACRMLENLDVTFFDTSNVENMTSMFDDCQKLKELDLSSFNTKNVLDMSYMFYNCFELVDLTFSSSFNTESVINMEGMFSNCRKIVNLNLSSFNTKNVLNMSYMFYNCLELVDLTFSSSFNTESAINMKAMFKDCSNLEALELKNFNTSSATTMAEMFWNCEKILKLDLSAFDTSLVTDMNHMFFGCKALTELELRTFDTSKVINMSSMFCHLENLRSIELNNFDTSNVTDMNEMFYGCKSLESLNLESFSTGKVTNMNYMFYNLQKVKFLNLANFDTSNITDMSYMFYNCESLQNLNVSTFNTEKVTNMQHMFFGCKSLVNLDLNFKTNNVRNMCSMFSYLPFETIDLSSFNTSNVTDMNEMFYGCENLTNLNIENFDFNKVTNIKYLFYDCKKLSDLNLGNFEVSNVVNAIGTFQNCFELKNLDLRNFDFSNVLVANNIITECRKLEVLRTPINVNSSLGDAVRFTTSMYDIDANEYTTLPFDNANSIVLFSREFLDTLMNLKGDAVGIEEKVIAYEKLPDVTKEYIKSIDEYASAINSIKLEYYQLLGNNLTNKILTVDENGNVNEGLEVFGIIGNVDKDVDGDGVDDFNVNLNATAIEITDENIKNKINEVANLENVLLSYDISLKRLDNGVVGDNILPMAKILVKITLPKEYYNQVLNIYHINSNNEIELVEKQVQKFEDRCLVYFEADSFSPYTLTSAMKNIHVTKEGNGTVSPDENVFINNSESEKIFSITIPNAYYAEIYVNGEYVETLNNSCNYALRNIDGDTNLHVKFLKNILPVEDEERDEEDIEGDDGKDDKPHEDLNDKNENNGSVGNNVISSIIVVDVKNKYHSAYISGFKDGTFRPNAPVSRGEVAALLARISSEYDEEKDYKNFIVDNTLNNDLWSINYIGFMYATGIMEGDKRGFRENSNITRAEFSKTIIRYMNIDTSQTEISNNKFSDINSKSWYAQNVIELANRGIINGYEDGTFKPSNNLTRAEAVKIINAISNRIMKCNLTKAQITELKNKFSDINENEWYFNDIYEASVSHSEDTKH